MHIRQIFVALLLLIACQIRVKRTSFLRLLLVTTNKCKRARYVLVPALCPDVGYQFALHYMFSSYFRYTTDVRILAPVFIFTLPYLAYLTAEMISLSSIIAYGHLNLLMKMWIVLQNRRLRDGDEDVRKGKHQPLCSELRQIFYQNDRPIDRNRHLHVSCCLL